VVSLPDQSSLMISVHILPLSRRLTRRSISSGLRGLVAQQGHGAGIGLGLEQAVDELQLEGADDRGGTLHAQVALEPAGQQVTVLRPPARRVGLPGQGQHPGPYLLICDAVQREQIGHVLRTPWLALSAVRALAARRNHAHPSSQIRQISARGSRPLHKRSRP
jgi:hypothetical protein